jgi:hypothetical protein
MLDTWACNNFSLHHNKSIRADHHLINQSITPYLLTSNNTTQTMEGRIQEDPPAFSASSQTLPSTDSQSENPSTNDQNTSGAESPPEPVANLCNGPSAGCFIEKPHCHLRCPPRACKQCREVLDPNWMNKGGWLEHCISLPEGDEQRSGGEDIPARPGFKKALTIGAFAVSVAGVLYCAWQARASSGSS